MLGEALSKRLSMVSGRLGHGLRDLDGGLREGDKEARVRRCQLVAFGPSSWLTGSLRTPSDLHRTRRVASRARRREEDEETASV